MKALALGAPLAGWSLPLERVPDPVFAGRLAGDGVAIDPTSNILHAPCDGELVEMPGGKHAVTVRTPTGLEILLHIGIDTVRLGGEGFALLERGGSAVRAGQPLVRFDLDLIARRAPSALTPILLASAGGRIARANVNRALQVGDFLMEIEAGETPQPRAGQEEGSEIHRAFVIAFEHGIHARPAGLITAALRPFSVPVTVLAHGRSANAHSAVALMSLGARRGDRIEVRATGARAAEALGALETLFAPASPASLAPRDLPRGELPPRLKGVIACRGIALGTAVQLTEPEIEVAESAREPPLESRALRAAIGEVRSHIEWLARSAGGEQRLILAAHVELVDDPDLAERAEEAIRRGKSAAFAWREATRATARALQALGDARLGERAGDLRDLENQVLRVLRGEHPRFARSLPARAILLADELLPSQLMGIDRAHIAGVCTARGGPTSHVAIIAAAMGVPALVAAGPEVLEIPEGTPLLLDAERGHLAIGPPAEEQRAIEHDLADRRRQQQADLAAARQECETLDHVAIAVYANLGSLEEAAPAIARGAQGCGLLRTEFLFLDRPQPPDEEEQAREYQEIADALGGRPLTIRTLDAGGDKPIAYLPLPPEVNPALGLRGLRTSLWRPDLLRTQLRAALRVRPARLCRLLLPMVTDVADVRAARSLLEECRAELGLSETPALGVMVETPASALLADQIAREVDFLSIGTNDLSQYALAMDRGHPQLAAQLDALHPAVLRLIAGVARAAHAEAKEVAVCGALGSDPSAIPILIGLGIREISAGPASIPRIKRAIRSLDTHDCERLAQQALEQLSAPAVRSLVEDWLAQPSPRAPQE